MWVKITETLWVNPEAVEVVSEHRREGTGVSVKIFVHNPNQVFEVNNITLNEVMEKLAGGNAFRDG